MAIKNSWASGEVLTAADLTDTMKGVYLNAQTGTTYTFGTADGFVTLSNASGGTATIPTNATAAFNIGAVIGVMNAGTAGSFVIAPAATVTLNAVSGTTTLAPLESATLVKLGTNTWQLAKGSGLPKATYSATTGAPTVDTTSRPGKTIVTFTGSGSITIAGNGGTCEMLVVGAGGGGGTGGAGGGGGGAGIVLDTNAFIPGGTLTVTVGAGGAGGTGGASGKNNYGFNGEASRVGSYFIPGGGSGAGYTLNSAGTPAAANGNRGGSGGGGALGGTGGTADTGSSGGTGSAAASNYGGGGGGGHSAAGANGTATTGGNGGAGLTNSIDGTSRVYGSGGGGGTQGGGTAGTGGTNAGNGTNSSTAAGNGTANFGGGGGGGGSTTGTSANGGNGGSGRVVLVFG